MATSGTVGQTVIDVVTLIEHSFRRTGVDMTKITSENLIAGRENLSILSWTLANRGVNLFSVAQVLVGLNLNQHTYSLPVGVVDVMETSNCVNGTFPTPANTITGAASYTIDFGTGVAYPVITVGITPANTANYTLNLQGSVDGVTWTTVKSLSTALPMTAGSAYWFEIQPTASYEFWQVVETVLPTAAFTSVLFSTQNNSLPMSKLTPDQYTALPNRTFPSSRVLQFMYDKQITPRIKVWPQPSDVTVWLDLRTYQLIQDVGVLTNTLAVPSRWYEAYLNQLAYRNAMELPKDLIDPERVQFLKSLAEEITILSENGESDGSRSRWAPNIGPYTR